MSNALRKTQAALVGEDRESPDHEAPPRVATAVAPGPGTDDVFVTENLSLFYRNVPAFKDVNLTIQRGRITALIGRSGCGKTSFLRSLNRLTDLIPHCRVTGRVRFESIDIMAPSTDPMALRHRIGMICQKPNPFPLSIRRNIELPLAEHGIRRRAQRDEIVERVLREVGLWDEVKDRLGSSALALSGGQKQRLCIARALALDPETILFDEPCSSLDPISSNVVEELIMTLRGKYTSVIVTHNLAQAQRVADDVAVFGVKDGVGHLIESNTCAAIFENSTNEYLRGIREF